LVAAIRADRKKPAKRRTSIANPAAVGTAHAAPLWPLHVHKGILISALDAKLHSIETR
jgi:hypothetical protein